MKKILFIILLFFSAPFVYAEVTYQNLAPLPSVGLPGGQTTIPINPNTLELYFKNLYRLGIVIATGLAVLMVMWGGIEYITTDAIGGKEAGKERIQNALLGLLLALSSYVILRTIDPRLLNVKFDIKEVNQGAIEKLIAQYYQTELQAGEILPISKADIDKFAQLGIDPNSPVAQRILQAAIGAIGTDTSQTVCGINPSDTNYGRKACALSVNMIIEKALGRPITNGLGTYEMKNVLERDPRFQLVPGGIASSMPGDIIISPTGSRGTGHVVIVEQAGGAVVIGNSSNARSIQRESNYGGRPALGNYVFRAR